MRTTMREIDANLDWTAQWRNPWTREEYLAPLLAFGLGLLIAWL